MSALLAATAFAGGDYSAKSSKMVVPPPAECHLQWFLAASAGYLTDQEEGMFHAQFGLEKECPTHSHALYLEAGYTEYDDDFFYAPVQGDLSVDVEIIPITLNYKYSKALDDRLNWYIGAGAGIALVSVDTPPRYIEDTDDDDAVFYAQAFTGFSYEFTDNLDIFLGARYIFMDDPDLDGAPFEEEASIDGDVLLEVGMKFNF